ncbi:integrating conjugative element protein pill, pfgi-1, partial [Pseudomonas aeruginosa]
MCPSPPWFHHPERRLLAGLLGLLWSVLAGGCATATVPHAPDAFEEVSTAPEPEVPEYIPVVRYGRYTLVESVPTAAQRDLLLQTIDISMPADARATV